MDDCFFLYGWYNQHILMKKLASIPAVLAILLAITGCPDGGDGNTDSARRFWAVNMATQAFYQLDAEILATNSICEVWAEKGSGVTAATANNVANAYYTVYAKMMNTFGYTVNDVNLGIVNTMEIAHWLATGKTSGAKLTILLLDIKDGYATKGDPYVGGYFQPLQLFEDAHSNKLDMIYVDTYPSVPGSQNSNETLAHEMQHLMNFVSSIVFRVDGNTLNLTDTWVDEGLSAATEWVYSGQHPEVRWKNYNEDPSKLIAKGNSFYIWGNHDDNPLAILDDYATVYLFFQYLRLQSDGSDDIYFDIHTSGSSDYRAVTTATNINSNHKNNWPLLLRDWYAANYTNNTSGLYGYMNDPTLRNVKPKLFPTTATSVNLYPGEGVYSRTTASGTVPSDSGNIKYIALSSTGAPSSTTSANGARLTYNVNTDIKGTSESGSTTGIAPSVGFSIPAGSASVQIGSKEFSGPFQVDMGYFTRRNGNNDVPDIEIKRAFDPNNSRSITNPNNALKFDISTLERVHIDE